MGRLSPAFPALAGAASAQTARMDLPLWWKRWLLRWHLPRAEPHVVRPPADPADCGTAWGLDLTLPPAAFDKQASTHRPSR